MDGANSQYPLVSVVTPVYNGAAYLDALVRSVRDQTYPAIEHIVIDDGSDDGGSTLRILESYPHLRWTSRENQGQIATINEGLRMASGRIITVINADDVYASPNAIAQAVDALLRSPALDGVYGITIRGDETTAPLPFQPVQRLPLWMLPYHLFIAHCSLFVWARAIEQGDLYWNPSYRILCDADWIVRLVRSGRRLGFVRHPIAVFRHHPDQASVTVDRAYLRSEYRRFREDHHLNTIAGIIVKHIVKTRNRVVKARLRWALRGQTAKALILPRNLGS